jgi:hypothetical protein
MIALKKKPKGTEYSDHCTAILIASAAMMVVKILRISKDILGENQFGFRRLKRTRDATGMLKIISERTLDIEKSIVCLRHRVVEGI